ncbi:MAG TPA: tetratricopeptide repeat protein [Ferruginibacter sp.]|jgi:tetratricopeptide (TPR) repeat protein|nr:tetratricopeptide repeat protein [Ferruginibacter sp.]
MKKYLLSSIYLLLSITVFSENNNATTSIEKKDSAVIYFQEGVVQDSLKHYSVASNYFDSAIALYPDYKDAYKQKGLVNIEMRRTDVAKATLIRAYELDTTDVVVIKQLSELYYDYRQFQKAIKFAKKCLNCENSERIIAMSYYEQEDYGNALPLFHDILTKNQTDVQVLYAMARSYLDMEEYPQAINYYKAAIQNDTTQNSRWVYELGLIYYGNDDYKDALASFLKAQDMGYAQTSDFNENIGFVYLYTGDFDKGEKILLGVIATKPGNTDLIRDMAQVFYTRKLYDKSLEYCQKLIEMDRTDAKALYQAGMCFQKKGEKSRGEKMCDQAIVLDPSLDSLRQKKIDMGL